MSVVFVIPTLLAAGFARPDQQQAGFTEMTTGPGKDPARGNLFEVFKQQHTITLAQHRSHSSHSSHSSHRSGYSSGHYSHMSHASHRSSYGGSAPAPVYTPPASPSGNQPAPSRSAPSSPESLLSTPSTGSESTNATAGERLQSLSGRAKKFEKIVRLVQIGLMAQGYYDGPLDGSVGPGTRSALRKFQAEHGISVTGTITPETLDALRVPSE
jgi:His-Xaa-Ser repeat protein HxsA